MAKCKRVRVDINTSRRGRGGFKRSFMAQRGDVRNKRNPNGKCIPAYDRPSAKQEKQRKLFRDAAKACNRVSRKPGAARSRCVASKLK